jgi:hypothetical protein
MKIRPSDDYWDTLDSSVREKFLTVLYGRIFYFVLFILIAVAIKSVVMLLDITP